MTSKARQHLIESSRQCASDLDGSSFKSMFFEVLDNKEPSNSSNPIAIILKNGLTTDGQTTLENVLLSIQKNPKADRLTVIEKLKLESDDPKLWPLHEAANRIWPSAIALSEYVIENDRFWESEHLCVLELGCGLGATGMLLAKFGLGTCVGFTDYGDVVPVMHMNLSTNFKADCFFVGDLVEMKDEEDEDWYLGIVTGLAPLEIRHEDDLESTPQEWDLVRKKCRAPYLFSQEHDWSSDALEQSTKELVDAALARSSSPRTSKFLILCADGVFAPLYGEESSRMLHAALARLFKDLQGRGLAAEAVLASEHRTPGDGVTEFHAALQADDEPWSFESIDWRRVSETPIRLVRLISK